MLNITIITLFPKMIEGFFNESIVKRAIDKELVHIDVVNLRDYSINDYGSVDDRPYGGGAGMVLRVEPIYKAIQSAISNFQFPISKKPISKVKRRITLTAAKGKQFSQKKAIQFAKLDHLVIIAGHYEGIDERVLEFVDEEISLGDFVMTGGELTAAAIADSVVRLVRGVLKKETATKLESFFEISIDRLIGIVGEKPVLMNLQKQGKKKVTLLEYPHYTRPEIFKGKRAPKVLLSGNHKDIEEWRLKNAFEITLKKRKDLLQ